MAKWIVLQKIGFFNLSFNLKLFCFYFVVINFFFLYKMQIFNNSIIIIAESNVSELLKSH